MVTKTYSPKAAELSATWRVLDAQDQVLGRLATKVAHILMGKHKPTYARHMNTGDYVIVVNAGHIDVTGNKRKQKIYYRPTGYIGGLRETSLEKMLERNPERVIHKAVKGMLPRTTLGAQMLRRLKIYAGPTHPHEAQVKGGESATRTMPRRARIKPQQNETNLHAEVKPAAPEEVKPAAPEIKQRTRTKGVSRTATRPSARTPQRTPAQGKTQRTAAKTPAKRTPSATRRNTPS